MKITRLGHVVLRVRDRARAERFYGNVLGLPICARLDEGDLKMTFFSLGDHHDFAVMEGNAEGDGQGEAAVGLHHVAFKIGTTLDQLREARATLQGAGVATTSIDHDVTKSLYFHDPDGNGVEVYVDVSDAWRREPQRIAHAKPFDP